MLNKVYLIYDFKLKYNFWDEFSSVSLIEQLKIKLSTEEINIKMIDIII